MSDMFAESLKDMLLFKDKVLCNNDFRRALGVPLYLKPSQSTTNKASEEATITESLASTSSENEAQVSSAPREQLTLRSEVEQPIAKSSSFMPQKR